MITDILKLTRPLVIIDTETTGVDTTNDRIVELAFQAYYPVPEPADFEEAARIGDQASMKGTYAKVKAYRTLINPGVPIPVETTEVHGITDEHVRQCKTCNKNHNDDHAIIECDLYRPWPTFKQLAPNLKLGFSQRRFLRQKRKIRPPHPLRRVRTTQASSGASVMPGSSTPTGWRRYYAREVSGICTRSISANPSKGPMARWPMCKASPTSSSSR